MDNNVSDDKIEKFVHKLHVGRMKANSHLRCKRRLRPMSHLQFYRTRFCRATLSQVWHGVSRNFSTVAQLLFRLDQRSILCNFVAKMRWTLIGQFLFMRQSCIARHAMSHLRRATKSQMWHQSTISMTEHKQLRKYQIPRDSWGTLYNTNVASSSSLSSITTSHYALCCSSVLPARH